MKKLLAALLLVPSLSMAQDTSWIARATNKSGGHIVITAVQGSCRQGQLAIYTTTPAGGVTWGCVIAWTDLHIMGRWNNGEQFAYDYGGWVVNSAIPSGRGSNF